MKKIVSVFVCLLMLFSCTGISTLTASAVTPAENAQPVFYFEPGVDVINVYFYIENAKGIDGGNFTFDYDSDVFSCSAVEQVYKDDMNFVFAANAGTKGRVKFGFACSENFSVDKLDVCVIQLEIVGDVSDVSYAEMSGYIDDVAFEFEPYPIEIVNLFYGDVDFNQQVTAADARLVLRASVQLEQFTETQMLLGDVDESGTITAADARMILRYSVGLDDLNPDASEQYMSLYDDLIKDFKKIVEYQPTEIFDDNWDKLNLSSTFMNMNNRAKFSYELGNMADEVTYWDDGTVDDYGYILYNLDDDGIPELFWVRDDHTILAVFTCKNNSVYVLDAFWSRYRCYISQDEKLYTQGSGGYADHQLRVYKLNGTELETEYLLESSLNFDSSIDYYEYINGQQKRISETEFYNLLKLYSDENSAFWKSLPINSLA